MAPPFPARVGRLVVAGYVMLLSGMYGSTVAVAAEAVKPSSSRAPARTSVLVPLPVESGWQDMAFLAAIPAATVVNRGAPSLIALDAAGAVTAEVNDYLRRYRPDDVFMIGGNTAADQTIANQTCRVIKASSADEAACAMSACFWRTSATAVITPEDDYEAGLIAAPLAARLGVPLLFATTNGLSPAATTEIRRLAAKELLLVGKLAGGWQTLKKPTPQTTELATSRDVMTWARNRKLSTDYMVALNPFDRSKTVVKKLSLAGALLAAGHKGLVTPQSYEVRWKIPFSGTDVPTQAADAKQDPVPKTGTITFDQKKYSFIVRKERDFKVSVDVNADGAFTGPNEGPFVMGDTVELDGKRYVISLNTEYAPGKADIRLTWPTAEQLAKDMRNDFTALGVTPKYLCLIGFPDAIPHAIFNERGVVTEVASDVVYANTDEDPFAEICVARLIGENASFGTLYASRALTYGSLLDPEWQQRACQARWENTFENLFENVGLNADYRHDIENLKVINPAGPGGKGVKRESTFDADSPLTRCLALAHTCHSSWQGLGETFDWNSKVLLSPMVIESGGCATAALDKEADYHSVVARLLRNGAISFTGNSRLGIAHGQVQRQEFWNGVLSGETLGEAHKRSMDSAQVTILDLKSGGAGGYLYQYRIRMLFGDPALTLSLPKKPRTKSASCVLTNDKLTVYAPSEWWPVKMVVPEDWKKWADKDLYVLRGAGTYPRCSWASEGYDKEEVFVTAEFTTRRRVAKIEQVQNPPAPLGWNGAYYADQHADGSCTYRWSVRLADFNQEKGTITNKVERLEYRITYQ